MCVLVVAYTDENDLAVKSMWYILTRGIIAWVIHLEKLSWILLHINLLIKISLKVIEFTRGLCIFKYLCYVTVKTL